MKIINIKSFFSYERIVLIIILLACFLSYFQIINHDFIKWDDDKQITDNSFVKNLNLESVKHNINFERYTLLTLSSFSVIYNIWGNNPVPFHCFSILLHLLNVILIFIFCKKLTDNLYVYGLVALLFALHPMRVESVVWISEIKDLLFTFFSIFSYLFYIKYLKNDFKIKYFVPVVLFALLASLSKIQGLLIPITLLIFDLYFIRKITVSLILEKIFIFLFVFFIFSKFTVIAIIVFFILFFVFRNRFNDFYLSKKIKTFSIITVALILLTYLLYYFVNNKSGLWSTVSDVRNAFSIFERLFLAGFALWFYLKNVFLPISQNAVHPYPQNINNVGFPNEYYYTLLILIFVIALSVYFILKRKTIPDLVFFGWFFFIVNISIVLHIIPIEGRLVVADRYSYLAYFGLFMIIAHYLVNLILHNKNFKKIYNSFFVIILILLSVLTYSRSMVWKDSKTLFNDVITKNSNISFTYNNLGGVYLNERKPVEALKNLNKSIRLDSLDPGAYFNRAMIYFMIGESDSAISDFNNVIVLSSSNKDKALAYTNIGEIYHKKGNDSLAFYYYNFAIKTDSLIATSFNNLGMFYFQKNDFEKALSNFEKAINLDSYYSDALNNRGWVFAKQNKKVEALNDYNKAIEINPGYALAYNNRGYLKFSTGDITGALKDYEKAIENDSSLLEVYLNRGWTYSSIGDYKNAVIDFSKVLAKVPDHQTAITNRAFAWFYLKEIKNAGSDFEAALKYFPENALSWQNIAWYHMQVKDYEKAIVEFEKSVSLDKSLVNSYLNLGWIWMQKKNFRKAKQAFDYIISYNPKNADANYWLGELYRQEGKVDLACKFFNDASLYGNNQAKEALSLYCKK